MFFSAVVIRRLDHASDSFFLATSVQVFFKFGELEACSIQSLKTLPKLQAEAKSSHLRAESRADRKTAQQLVRILLRLEQ